MMSRSTTVTPTGSGRARLVAAVLTLLLATFSAAQGKSGKSDGEAMLREAVSVFEKSGAEGLRVWTRANASRLESEALTALAKQALVDRSRDRLEIARLLAGEKGERKCLAGVLYLSGEYCRLTSDGAAAGAFYAKALVIYEGLGDPAGQAEVIQGQGDLLSGAGENEKAMAMYERALALLGEGADPSARGRVLKSEADIYLMTGEYEKALALYGKARPLFESAGYLLGQGNVAKRQGDIFLYTNEYGKALEKYGEARSLYERAGDTLGQANVAKSQGIAYYYRGENEKALASYDKALPLYEKAGDILGQANVTKSQGDVFLYTGENAKALAMYEKALPLYEKAGDPLGLGNVYLSEGQLCSYTGQSARALEKYEKALEFYEKAEEPLGQGNVCQLKGDVYLRVGDTARALAMYEKALPRFEQAQDRLGQGGVCLQEGDLFLEAGETDKAAAMYEKALSHYEAAGEPLGQGTLHLRKGELALDRGDAAGAGELFEKARALFEKAGDVRSQGYVCQGQGDVLFRGGDYPGALDQFARAREIFAHCGDLEGEAQVLFRRARALARAGRAREASPLFEEALDLLERLRSHTGLYEMKKSFLEKVADQYEEAARFMLENGEPEKAFRVAESLKARVFLDSLAEGLVDLEKGISPELKEKRDRLNAKLAIRAEAVTEAVAGGDAAKLSAAKEGRVAAEAELAALQTAIRLQNPLYASVRYPQPASAKEIRAAVLRPGETLVEYFQAGDALYAFVVDAERFRALRLSTDPRLVRARVRAYLHVVSAPPLAPSAGEDRTGASGADGRALYTMLFKPLESELPKNTRVILVPDGELCRLPFESLVISSGSGRPRYLMEKRPISYIQSASVLAFLRARERGAGADSFAGFGDPVYDYAHFQKGEPESGALESSGGSIAADLVSGQYSASGGTLARLPGTGQEVTQIAEVFQGKRVESTANLRLDAREENAKSSRMKEVGYIHFSCHGLLGDGFQGLALSRIPGAKEDGFLTSGELMNCDWNARLVVLSACQTGSGTMERGEGVTNLTRAVMYAGTPAAVVSLWSVSDAGTRDLMVRFYRNLIEAGLPKDEALRRAKLEMIRDSRFASPFYWSPFVLYGE